MSTRAGLVGIVSAVIVVGLAVAPEAGAQLLGAVDGAVAVLDRESVPAAGEHAVTLTVRRFGRFTISVSSEEGVALQLVDRMAGPGPVRGTAGKADGRLDLFLDRGEYRILTQGHPKATGEATLAARPFVELNADPAPQLVEFKPVATSLGDLEQRSYWLQVEARRWVDLEVAGRALADLRLWRDGSWLVDAEPVVDVVEPAKGRPLAVRRLALQLEPGLYLLSVYGGEAQPWAEGGEDFPLHLRFGIPTVATAGRSLREVGPMGIDRYLVPAEANFYRVELPEARPASLLVREHSISDPFAGYGRTVAIDKDSRVPAAEVETDSTEDGWNQVVVRAAAGQPYVLQHFQSLERYNFAGTGEYWISSVHSGHAEDSVDATAIIAHWDSVGRLQKDPLREQTIAVDGSTGWATRCNLLDPLTIFLHVRETGAYTINSQGVEAGFRFEPFFVYRPHDYEAPPFRGSGEEWSLDAGYYVLTVTPRQKGILEMEVKPDSLVESLLALIGFSSDMEEASVTASVRFESVPLEANHNYTMFYNRQPGVRSGLVLRPLPVSLDDALPLTIRPGENVQVPFTVSEESLLWGLTEGGQSLEVSVNSGEWRSQHAVPKGTGRVALRNDTEATVVCSLAATPTRLLSDTPLPLLPRAALDALPDFPELRVDEPLFFDLARGQRRTALVSAGNDALYRLETTGLLDTEGTLRSRTNTSVAASSGGGSGRNFFLHQVLLSGSYQVSVSARGESAGHLGLRLTRTDPADGGALEAGLPVRLALAAGETVAYRFRIATPGNYRLRSQALGRSVRCRLTDGDGWPLLPPGGAADITRWFEAGEYRLVLLPEPVPGRRLTLLEEIPDTLRLEGHGPHVLPLDTVVRHRWMEPEDGDQRRPDVWRFDLPAPSRVEISLSPKMTAALYRLDNGARATVADLPPGRGFDDHLAAGEYTLEVVSGRPDNLLDYELEARPEALMDGMARTVTAPATLPVSVGRAGQLEISSFGDVDVKARLEDGDGRVLLANDDRPGDWNFLLGAHLDPGQYVLQVQPVGRATASTSVRVGERPVQVHETVRLPLDMSHSPGSEVHVFPMAAVGGEMLLASARSADAVGLAVERRDGGGWRTLVSRVGREVVLEVPVAGDGELRLRLWSVDRRGDSVRLMAASVVPQVISESRLARGLTIAPVPSFEPPVVVAEVDGDGAGVLRLQRGGSVRWSTGPDRALGEPNHKLLPLGSGPAFVTADAARGKVELRAKRVVIESGDALQLSLDAGDEVLVDVGAGGDGPVVVRARSTVAQPMVSVTDSATSARRNLAVAGVSDRDVVSVVMAPREPVVSVWVGSDEDEPVDLRLTAFTFDRPAREALGFGTFETLVEPAAAQTFDLPKGEKALRLTQSAGVVAALHTGREVASVHWAGDLSRTEMFTTSDSSLTVFALGDFDGRFAVEILAATGDQAGLGEGSRLERRMVRGGRLRVPVARSAGRHKALSVAGEVTALTFISDQGRVLRGDRLEIGAAGGTLLIDHEPGPVAVWFGSDEGLWTGVDEPRAKGVDLPVRLALDGSVRRFKLEGESESLLEVECSTAAVLRVETESRTSTWVELSGGVRHILAPRGRVEVGVRGFGGGAMAGELALAKVAISRASEGLGPERLLAPGEGHAYRFTVRDDGWVGVGVRSDPDTAECELVNPAGEVLGSGVIQMHELEAGDYLLVVSAPADSEPVRVRPAVVGVDKPPSGPPEDVIREYIDLARSQS